MKNKAGIISGFVIGVAGFLFLFKLIILDRIPPEDEIAPGMVLIASVFSGFFFAFVGYLIQGYLAKKRN
jgi:hypothetical protein